MTEDYKSAKEAFVSNMTGSSMGHINLVSMSALLSVSFYAAFKTRIFANRNVGFLISWTVLVLPLLLSMTLFANSPLYLIAILLVPTVLLLQLPRQESGTPLPSSKTTGKEQGYPTVSVSRLPPLPALTTYRSHMMLMTVLGILAVDFPVFPRSLVKCETFGASLMDLGVGSFVFSQGVVSAIPLIKDSHYISAPFVPKLIKVTTKSFPIILLGLIRVLLVKGTDYPEHVTEYGVHWNFFITLALLPVLQVILHPLLQRFTISIVGAIVALLQQVLLSQFSLDKYVLHAPRTSLISKNKEGIISLLGYFAIHLLGLSVGTLVLPPTPSSFSRRQKALRNKQKTIDNVSNSFVDISAPRQYDKTAVELCAYTAIWWFFLFVVKWVRIGGTWGPNGGISRRMVNLPYILWIAAYNTSFILLYIVVLDMWISVDARTNAKPKKLQSSSTNHHQSPTTANRVIPSPTAAATTDNPPRLFEAINKHSLAIFLIANLFTGFINLSLPTMYMDDALAMGILSLYSMTICAIGWFWPSGLQRLVA